jgi:hypothetical protein
MPPKGGDAKPRAYTKAAGLPKETSYAPPLFHDRSCRGLRCSRGYGLAGVDDIQTGRGPRKASLPKPLVVADAGPVTNNHANPHTIPFAHPQPFSFP